MISNFFSSVLILGALIGGGMWLKNHYQDFLKKGINYVTTPPKTDNHARDLDDPEKDLARDEQNNTNKNNKNDNLPIASTQFKASPTNLPNAQKIQRGTDNYEFVYIFRDSKEKGVEFKWLGNKKVHDALPKKFGLPKDFFDGAGRYTQQQIDELQRKGSFRQATIDGKQFTIPDYNKIARDNRPVTQPIYKMIRQYLGKACTNTKLIEVLMVFCQDIPYKRPPASRRGKYTGELDVPAKMLTVGTGDCDTKSVFFASALLHQPNIKVAVVLVDNPSHMFAVVKGTPTPYQAHITFQGEKYIVCEPVGNARLPMGQLGFKDCRTRLVVKINP